MPEKGNKLRKTFLHEGEFTSVKQEEMFGAAKWVGCDGVTRAPVLRASFRADAARRAEVTICGLGYFTMYLNGRRVSDDLFVPATSDYVRRPITVNGEPFDEEMGHRCYCLKYDLLPFWREGENELAFELAPGFFAEPMWSFDGNVAFGEVRLCYRIAYETADGSEHEVLSGEELRWHESVVERCEFFRGEEQNLNRCAPDWALAPYDGWRPVRILPPMETEYLLQPCPADRMIRQITPRLIAETPKLKIYDAGENITGWVVLEDESCAGERIEVRFSEAVDSVGTLHERFMQDQYFRVVSDGRGRVLHPRTTWNGFRCFSVNGRAKVKTVAVIHSDVPVTSAFRCSSKPLTWLYDAFVRTELMNLHGGIPSDCPHLERKGYTGDGQLTAETALLTLNHKTFLRKWLDDILDCQDRNSGHVQYTAPYTRNGGGPGGWGCAIVMVPWQYYRHYGEMEALRAAYPGMCRYIDYLAAHSEGDLVVSDRPGEWCLGDWLAPGGSKLDPPFVNTYCLVRSLEVITRVEALLGLPENPDRAARIEKAKAAMTAKYFDAVTGDFCGNIEGANAFAVDIGLGDGRTLARMIAHYEALGGFDTGIIGTEIVPRVLFEKGQADLAYRLLTSENMASFVGMMRAGATTLWEYWPGDKQRSLNHPMFGATAKELFHRVLGIRQPEGSAGWERAVIEPVLTEQVPEAEGRIATPRGEIAVRYALWAGRADFDVTVPAGVQAELIYRGETIPLQAGTQHIRV